MTKIRVQPPFSIFTAICFLRKRFQISDFGFRVSCLREWERGMTAPKSDIRNPKSSSRLLALPPSDCFLRSGLRRLVGHQAHLAFYLLDQFGRPQLFRFLFDLELLLIDIAE